MALQLWCPLLGNNINQGISNVTLTSPGSTMSIVNTGKLGKTYDNSSKTAGGFRTSDVVDLGSAQSMFCWFRFVSLSDNSALGCGIISQHRYPKNTGLGITVKYISSTTGYLSANTGTGSSRTYNTYCGSTLLQANTWYHVGITYDGTNVLKLYVNGVCDGTYSVGQMSTPADYIMLYCWSLSSSSGSTVHNNYVLNGAMNDARVYDECLSTKEVEILARGLVLHYPLTGGGCANLAKGTNTASTSTNTFGFSEATGGSTRTIEYEVEGGTPCAKITRNSTAHSSWSYLWYNNWDRNAIKPSTTYTLSMDVKGSGSGTIGFSAFMQGNATNSITASVETIQNTFNASGWSHLVWRTTTISDFTDKGTSQTIYMSCGFLTNTEVWIMMKNLKLEEGSVDTPWTPHTSDDSYTSMGYNSTTIYDTSGYTNNGKLMYGGYTSDTPRYSVATSLLGTTVDSTSNTITGAQWLIGNCSVPASSAITFAWWGKGIKYGRGGIFCTTNSTSGDVPNTDYSTTAVCNWDSTFRIYNGSSAFNFFTKWSPTAEDNTWHHHAITFNGTTASYYLDGALASSAALSGTIPAFNGICFGLGRAGGVYRQIKEHVSDFRIYATALNAEDIQKLYNKLL